MRFYSVHERDVSVASDPDVVLVREGFSWLAFLLPMVWALWHRLWLALLLYVALGLIIGFGAEALGLSEVAEAVLGLGLGLLCGLTARDWRRAKLARLGYREVAMVAAPSLVEAERRFFENRTEATKPAPATSAPPRTGYAGQASFPGFVS